jgi:hypothetical protein
MGIFFATAPFTHLVPRQFFGLAFWAGFLLNTAITETWLNTGPRRTGRPALPSSRLPHYE